MEQEEKKLAFTNGVTRDELGILVLVVAFAITLAFAFYKAVVAGDFPSNITDFLTMLAFAIGLREAVPMVVKGRRQNVIIGDAELDLIVYTLVIAISVILVLVALCDWS